MRWVSRIASVALALAVAAGTAGASAQVELRPIDRSVVRIVALTGVVGARDQNGRLQLGVRAGHGSGVYVTNDGWVATAAHVVTAGDLLVVVPPGADEGRVAEVVYVGGEQDVALLRVSDRPADYIEPVERAGLVMGQTINVIGYPLDPRERFPAVASGQVGRGLNDGRVQLSISVNPGNSGGPVLTERGQLVGIVSQGADPTAGAQGIAVMEPIGRLTERLRMERATPHGAVPNEDVAAQLLLEQIESRGVPELEARIQRLRAAATASPGSAALFAVEAVDLAHALEARGDVEQRDELMAIGRRWSAFAATDDPDYAVLANLDAAAPAAGMTATAATTSTAPMRAASANVTGPATGPSTWAPETEVTEEMAPWIGFPLGVRSALLFDDARNEDELGGGLFGVTGALRLFLGWNPYFRTSLDFGGLLEVGGWRETVVFVAAARLGGRMEIGPRDFAVVTSLAWTPGYVLADGRETATGIGYEAGLGAKVDWLEIGIHWREMHRGAGTPLRSLTLSATIEVTP